MTSKNRVVYLLFHYPSITEAYIESEIRAVSHEYEVLVIAIDRDPRGITVYNQHSKFKMIHEDEEIEAEIKSFNPRVVHTHRLFMLPRMLRICEKLGVPFTVRSHAHDAIPSNDPRVSGWMKQAPDVLQRVASMKLCLGILAFPFARQNLKNWGMVPEKIFDCYPVIDFNRFHDTSPNGNAVVNSGSYMPKKKNGGFS